MSPNENVVIAFIVLFFAIRWFLKSKRLQGIRCRMGLHAPSGWHEVGNLIGRDCTHCKKFLGAY